MFTKVAVLCAVFVAVSCNGLVNTGVSSGSRVQDGHGNYAFEYGIASAGAKRSRHEVGSGWAGPVKTSYAVADSHIAPIAPIAVGHAGLGLGGLGLGGLGCGGLGCGVGAAGLGHGGLGLGLGGLGVGRLGLGVGGLGLGGHGLGLAGVGKLI